jgi:Tol biopolymer transport system component
MKLLALMAALLLLTIQCTGARSNTRPSPRQGGITLPGRFIYSDRNGDLWVVDGDGRNRRRVTRSGSALDFDPSFSGDGHAAVFRSNGRRNAPLDPQTFGLDQIRIVNLSTGSQRRIDRHGGLFPDWDPRGDRIAYSSVATVDQALDAIYVTRLDGERRPLGLTGECAEYSPDGSLLAYCSHAGGALGWTVWIANADGAHPRQLTDDGSDYPGPFSPDGRKLLYTTSSSGRSVIHVIDLRSGKQRVLSHSPRPQSASAWLPGGRIVVATAVDATPFPRWSVVDLHGNTVGSLPQLEGATDPVDWSDGEVPIE